MSATIWSTPKEVKKPMALDFTKMAEYRADEKRYLADMKVWCEERSYSKFTGTEISIPHADSAAYYMVLSIKPLRLIHLEIGDAWDSPHADLLTAKRVKEMIKADEAMAKLFPGRM